jgi:D-amino-acid dehydrogenase
MRIAIIGAGIVGLATAYELILQGHEVHIFEKESGVGRGTSFANGAQLSYAYVQPLATPATLLDLPKYLIDPAAPLKIKFSLDPQFWRWSLQFLLACRHTKVMDTTRTLLALAARSRQRFETWRKQTHHPLHFSKNGKLVVYPTTKSLAGAAQQVALQASPSLAGPTQSVLNTAACVAIEPALAPYASAFVGGVWTPSECVVDAYQTCIALQQDIEQRGGHFHFATPVNGLIQQQRTITHVQTTHGAVAVDAVIIANGSAAGNLLQPLGLTNPLYPMKGYSITLPKSAFRHAPTRSVTDIKRKIVFAPLGDAIRVAGMAELVGHDLTLSTKRIDELVQATDEIFGLVTRPTALQPWAGLRPATPDSLPRMGRTPYRGLYLNIGHGALGLTLAFGAAEQLAQHIAEA